MLGGLWVDCGLMTSLFIAIVNQVSNVNRLKRMVLFWLESFQIGSRSLAGKSHIFHSCLHFWRAGKTDHPVQLRNDEKHVDWMMTTNIPWLVGENPGRFATGPTSSFPNSWKTSEAAFCFEKKGLLDINHEKDLWVTLGFFIFFWRGVPFWWSIQCELHENFGQCQDGWWPWLPKRRGVVGVV